MHISRAIYALIQLFSFYRRFIHKSIATFPQGLQYGKMTMSAYAITILVLAVAYTFYMGYSDGSNAVATCVASHSLKPYAAIVVSAICKFVTPLLLIYIFVCNLGLF